MLLLVLALGQACHLHIAGTGPDRQSQLLADDGRNVAASCPLCLALNVPAVAPAEQHASSSLAASPLPGWNPAEFVPRRLALKLSCRPPPAQLL